MRTRWDSGVGPLPDAQRGTGGYARTSVPLRQPGVAATVTLVPIPRLGPPVACPVCGRTDGRHDLNG